MKTFREYVARLRSRTRDFVKRNLMPLIALGLLACLVLGFFFNRIVVLIHPGELGVLWRMSSGTEIETVYREGLHLLLPINKMYVYNVRKQEFSDSIDVLTFDGLTLRVDYTARYYPDKDTLTLLHQRVGQDYLNVVVRPDIRAVIRTLFGQYRPEEIYTSQKAIQDLVSELSKSRLSAKFVVLDDVPIEKITLPSHITKAIEAKMVQQQLEGEYAFRLSIATKEAERLRIESDGLRTYNENLSRSLNPSVLQWHGVTATRELAKSDNAKVVVIGAGESGLPIILGKD
jgi:regulator of protease activity HflC (stomatin/prohibitin superfamily)